MTYKILHKKIKQEGMTFYAPEKLKVYEVNDKNVSVVVVAKNKEEVRAVLNRGMMFSMSRSPSLKVKEEKWKTFQSIPYHKGVY